MTIYHVMAMGICMGICFFLPEYKVYSFFLFLIPAFIFLASGLDGMARNLDFHRMNIPVKHLKKAFFLDLLIQTLAFLFVSFVTMLVPFKLFMEGSDIRLHPMLFVLSGTISYTLFAVALFLMGILNLRISARTWGKKEYFIGGGLVLLLSGAAYSLSLAGYNPVFFIAVTVFALMTARFYHFTLTAFEPVRWHKRKGHFLRVGLSSLCAVVFSFSCARLVQYEMNDLSTGPAPKFKTMFVFSDFIPKLSPQTVRTLIRYPFAAEMVLKHASPAVYKLPADLFIDKNDESLINAYLTHGKPTPENLMYIRSLQEGVKMPERRVANEYEFR